MRKEAVRRLDMQFLELSGEVLWALVKNLAAEPDCLGSSTSCVILVKVLNLSGPQIPHL